MLIAWCFFRAGDDTTKEKCNWFMLVSSSTVWVEKTNAVCYSQSKLQARFCCSPSRCEGTRCTKTLSPHGFVHILAGGCIFVCLLAFMVRAAPSHPGCMFLCLLALMVFAGTNAASSPVLQEHSLTSWLLQTASHRTAQVQLTQPSSTRSLNH